MNDELYTGEWRDGKRHGHGIQEYADGSSYEGEWREDTQCGHGIFEYSNGDRYTGHFSIFPITRDTSTLAGLSAFLADLSARSADLTAPSADLSARSTGQPRSRRQRVSLRHGFGLYVWADGSRWEGEWVRGEKKPIQPTVQASAPPPAVQYQPPSVNVNVDVDVSARESPRQVTHKGFMSL